MGELLEDVQIRRPAAEKHRWLSSIASLWPIGNIVARRCPNSSHLFLFEKTACCWRAIVCPSQPGPTGILLRSTSCRRNLAIWLTVEGITRPCLLPHYSSHRLQGSLLQKLVWVEVVREARLADGVAYNFVESTSEITYSRVIPQSGVLLVGYRTTVRWTR